MAGPSVPPVVVHTGAVSGWEAASVGPVSGALVSTPPSAAVESARSPAASFAALASFNAPELLSPPPSAVAPPSAPARFAEPPHVRAADDQRGPRRDAENKTQARHRSDSCTNRGTCPPVRSGPRRRTFPRVDDQNVFRAIGLRIVELRQERGVTQETLAARIGLDSRDLRRIEAGSNATVRTLNAIATALSVPLATIFETPSARELRRPGRPPTTPAPTTDIAANTPSTRGRKRATAKRKPR